MVVDNSRVELSVAGGGAVIGGLNRGAFLRNEKVTEHVSENYYKRKPFLSAGFPTDFQIKYTTDHHFAIGFNIASCINRHFSYISAMVIFTFGKIK
ncbi:MAG: hypothetical protein GX556_11060 [Fibrobacter sp.]|nr:hypothetical protein [Fibrobacter sp.]